uniref:Type II secretion system protein J n=1 Tax=Candidatus Kentrum sp. LFY TaxID=2126342 RepID=A0A450WX31_9GAMM|nr:MAG: general secretion pathway protein J [Candidatus Kentron sp. LFY]
MRIQITSATGKSLAKPRWESTLSKLRECFPLFVHFPARLHQLDRVLQGANSALPRLDHALSVRGKASPGLSCRAGSGPIGIERFEPRTMKKRQPEVCRKPAGMTLIELLIALAVFAVISTITYGAIRTATETQQRIQARSMRFGALQKTMAVIDRDVSQIVNRPIRDEYGEPLPALQASKDDFHLMEFTRTGWQTLVGANRTPLRRIAYALDDGRLLRLVWSVLDRAEDSSPRSSVLLTGVDTVDIRYLDADDQWLSAWPLQWTETKAGPGTSHGISPGTSSGGLPRAVEIGVDVAGIGRITRLLTLPGG